MKHLLSKLTLLGIVSLIFVSCSKSPEQYVENCADDSFSKSVRYYQDIAAINEERIVSRIKKLQEEILYRENTKKPLPCKYGTKTTLCFAPLEAIEFNCSQYNEVYSSSLNKCASEEEAANAEIRSAEKYISILEDEIIQIQNNLQEDLEFEKNLFNLSLKDKLFYQFSDDIDYEDHFSDCSKLLESEPLKFKAKWK